MGDYSSALWIDPSGTVYHAGYDPFFEEGGFARFIEAENRCQGAASGGYRRLHDLPPAAHE